MKEQITKLREASLVYTLEHCRLFVGLPREELEEIAAFTVIKSLQKGDYLFHEGDEASGFFIVQKGTISVHRVNSVGKEQVIHIFRDGESFAEGSLATDKGYPAEARAVEGSQLLMVRKSDFVDLLGRRPDLALRMLASMAMHLRDLVGHIEDLTLRDVETRLANWLLNRCPDTESDEPVEIELTISKQAIAAELSTISATLSRTFAHLREQGLIEVEGKRVKITSPEKLTRLIRSRTTK